jgi:hypothetical protein
MALPVVPTTKDKVWQHQSIQQPSVQPMVVQVLQLELAM